jgi:GMP synthase-like glutamine amidotransferase
MILIVDVCSERLSYFEFVKPVEDIVRETGLNSLTKDFLDVRQRDVCRAEKVIVCGTALKDFKYLSCFDKFGWIREADRPVLGICAGMQVLVRLLGGSLVEKTRIGRYKVKVICENDLTSKDEFDAYFLSSMAQKPNGSFTVLARSGDLDCMIKHEDRGFYGCLFHPEVLNPEIIKHFLQQSTLTI